MKVNAGELRQRIQIVQIKYEPDADGYSVPQEELVHRCWAKVTFTSGTELVKANSDFGQVKARFLIRHTNIPIDRKMLVRHGGRNYEIEFVHDYEYSHQYMEIWGTWRDRKGG